MRCRNQTFLPRSESTAPRWSNLRGRWTPGGHWAAAIGILCSFLSACDQSRESAVIGVPILVSKPGVTDVAQAVLDSVGGRDPIQIVIDSGYPTPAGDSALSLAAAVTVAGRMASLPGLVGIVGHAGSRDALVAAPIYNQNKVPQVVPTANAGELARAGPWTFMLAPDDSLEGEFIARFAAERLRARTATILYVTDQYGNGLRHSTARALRRRGISVLDEVLLAEDMRCGSRPIGQAEGTRLDAMLHRGTPDLIILASRTPESFCILASVRGPSGLRFVAGDGTVVPSDLIDDLGVADSLYVVAFWYPGRTTPESRAFVRRFEQMVGRSPDVGDAMAYDAIMTLGNAVRTVGADRKAIRDYLNSLGRSRPAGTGVTGPIVFPASGENLLMMQRVGDQWVPVEFP